MATFPLGVWLAEPAITTKVDIIDGSRWVPVQITYVVAAKLDEFGLQGRLPQSISQSTMFALCSPC